MPPIHAARFDEKFGSNLVAEAPTGPGVYRYLDSAGEALYVGKAKNLRRRLSSYRCATRKRVHRKMRLLVREARALVFETCETEQAAKLRENELIRELRPPYNVDGAFAFLYPSIGIAEWEKCTLLCFTTQPDAFADLELEWFGCFRSRSRVKLAMEALIGLLSLTGHREKSARLPGHPKLRGSRMVGFRRLPQDVSPALRRFLAGEDDNLPRLLARVLLTKPAAFRDPAQVESDLKTLRNFFARDALRLNQALRAVGGSGTTVAQEARDALFIRAAG